MNKVTEWSEEELEELWQTLEGMYSLETLRIHTQHEFPGDYRMYEVPRNILDYTLPTPVLEEGEDFAKRRRNLAGALEERNLDEDGEGRAQFTGDVLTTCIDAAGQGGKRWGPGGEELEKFRALHSFLRKYYGLPLLANPFEQFIAEMPAEAGLYILRAFTPMEYRIASYILEAYNINVCHSP